MASRLIFVLGVLVSAALAAPSRNLVFKKALGPRQDQCDYDGDQTFVARIGFYTEHDCNERFDGVCIFTSQEVIDNGEGAYGCNPGLLPDTTPFYSKLEESDFDPVQVFFTGDQSCPPNGPGAVFASLINSDSCVLMNSGGDGPGISVYPNGGSDLARLSATRDIRVKSDGLVIGEALSGFLRRQDGTACDGFSVESEEPSYSESVQVSSVVDCTNGADAGCEITVGEEQSQSVSTSMELSAGGGIEGIFEISATFGIEYTETSTTSIQQGFSIPQGEKGYLSAYSAATLFSGTFTGCDSGDEVQEGRVLAIKDNAFTYSIIYTGSRLMDVVHTKDTA